MFQDRPEKVVTTEPVKKRLSKARLWLANKMPFFGYLTFSLRLIPEGAERHGVPTAAIANDGSLYINQQFSNTLSDALFRFVLVHEVLHPGLGFFQRQGSKGLRLWNVAHDYAINLICKDYAKSSNQSGASFRVYEHALLDEKFRGWSAEEIYDHLLNNQDPNASGGEGHGDARRDLATTGVGKKAERGCQASQSQIKHTWASKMHEAVHAHEAQKGKGSLPSSLQKLVDSLLTPQVYWDEYLQNYLGERLGQEMLTYSRPNRRSAAVGEIMPGRRRRNSPDVTVLWDTSGSQNGWEQRVLSEIQGICEDLGAEARVIVIDTAIHADVMIEDAEEVITEIKGGGGSNFVPAFDRLEEECDTSVVLAFTDGYIDVPSTKPEQLQDVLWVITEGGKKPVEYGQEIHISKTGVVQP
jgi:predicted metal-dependent peptidase